MKTIIEVKEVTKLNAPNGESTILDVKLIEGITFLVSDSFANEDDNNFTFKIASIAVGAYDYEDDMFSVIIEVLAERFDAEDLKGKKFYKIEVD